MSSLVRHVTPVAEERAKGVVAEVHAQVNAEFSSIGPAVLMMSPAPELMAAGWSLMRESQLAGAVSPVDRTLVALGVSRSNGLEYDIRSYLAALRLLGEPELAGTVERGDAPADPARLALLDWASSTGVAEREPLPAPFPAEEAAEYVGTLLFTHFVNRVAAAMLPAGLTPGTLDPADEPPFEGAPVLRDLRQELRPGTTMPLLDGLPEGELPEWADGLPIGRAYAALAATASQGAGLLTPDAAETVSRVIAGRRGRRASPAYRPDDALSGLTADERPGALVAILAALAPEALTDEDVAAWRATDRRFSDHCTVFLLAYGAMAAVTMIEADLTFATPLM